MSKLTIENNYFSKLNSINVDLLFQKYADIGFIYEAKRKLLNPFMSQINSNWKKLLQSNDDLMWIFTNNESTTEGFASVSAWRHTDKGMLAQHLVSDGNPFLSLRLMLDAQLKAENAESPFEVTSSQNWFRADNRYAFRVFSSMVNKLGPKKSGLNLFHQLKFPIDIEIERSTSGEYILEEVDHIDKTFLAFVGSILGEVFIKAEDLDGQDIKLSQLRLKYEKCGLKRSRNVMKLKCSKSEKILGCFIANKAPIGLNFSFLENRCYYLINPDLSYKKKLDVISVINQQLIHEYSDIELNYIPIVTDESTSELLQESGATYLRKYLQSIWLKEGFREWYEHINSFLKRIESRYPYQKVA